MPAPYDVVYMLVDKQLGISPKPIFNRYFFGSELTGTPNAQDLVATFVSQFLPFLVGSQVNTFTHVEVSAVNVSNVFDYFQQGMNMVGLSEADGLPPASPFGFQSAQPGYGVRGASKRFSGMPEAWQADGAIDGGVANILNIATQLGTPIEGDDSIYYPVVVTMPKPATLPLESVPQNRDAIFWTPRQFISTQVTRRQ